MKPHFTPIAPEQLKQSMTTATPRPFVLMQNKTYREQPGIFVFNEQTETVTVSLKHQLH